ncbi:MAG: hemolysin family protein [Oscillospiraceae bacterium]|nr:hemolysin family protein [Oscillospiraceae bacterium]
MDDPPLDSQSVFALSILIFLLLLSAFFSATEMAFAALSRVRVKHMAESGSKRAALALKLYDRYDKLLSTIVIGNNAVNIAAASAAAVYFVRRFGDVGATLSAVVVTAAVILFSEITPKSLAKEAPEKFALFSAPLIRLFMVVLAPLNGLFAYWKKLLGAIFKTSPDDRAMTEQELLIMVEEAEQEGAIGEEDKTLIHSAIEFNDRRAEDILTSRVDVTGIPADLPPDDVAKVFMESGFSRLPVYDGSIDNIIGIAHLRDFMKCVLQNGQSVAGIISPAVFVAPGTKISDLLKRLQKEKSHMAIVSDEYGGTAGIVTMEDILEELVGEIWDETDEIIEEFVALGEDCYKIICSADVDKMFEYFSLTGTVDSSTVSGWIMDTLGKIPEEGDSFTYENLTVTVTKAEHRRVLECVITVGEKDGDG